MTQLMEDWNFPISQSDLLLTVNVLKLLENRLDLLDSIECRELRKVLAPISVHLESKKFSGKGRKKYLEDKQIRSEREGRLARQAALDKKYINSVQLRQQRIQTLEELQKKLPSDINLVPDGCSGISSEISDEVEKTNLNRPRSCYICKKRFVQLHFFYDQLCPGCADLNYLKRTQRCDFTGKVALVTGGRVKIGFQCVMKLLSYGAFVIVTTRFPKDAALRFSSTPEFDQFKNRLRIYGVDFRDLVHLESFMNYLIQSYPKIDIIIHNACQTVRRPPAFYRHLIETEMKEWKTLPQEQQNLLLKNNQYADGHHDNDDNVVYDKDQLATLKSSKMKQSLTRKDIALSSALTSQIPLLLDDHDNTNFPNNSLDVNFQQIDLRKTNSWVLKIESVATPELAEVFAINTMAPFIMNSRLVPHMEKSEDAKYIINVSAMEGKFYRYKTPFHPHTNMAKAALNMMTKTCAEDLSQRKIYMNSVDTGWINDENPLEKAYGHATTTNFQTPIDEIDASSRILDPIICGHTTGKPQFGMFFKDYRSTEW